MTKNETVIPMMMMMNDSKPSLHKLSDFKDSPPPPATAATATAASSEGGNNSLLMSNPLFWIAIQATCSICLTLFNKQVATDFRFPFIIIAIQNLASIALFLVFNKLGILPMQPIRVDHLVKMVPTTVLFSLMLWTSLEGLRIVSVTLVVVARNFVPLVTGVIESVTSPDFQLSNDGYSSLALVGVGSVLYGITDTTLNFQGMQWLLLNMAFVVVIPMVEKNIMKTIKQEQTPTGVTFYRNLISVPILLTIAFLRNGTDTFAIVGSIVELPTQTLVYFILTCVFGFGIGVAYFFLIKLISSTTLAITNTAYKLMTLSISLFMYPAPFSGVHSWIGVVLSFGGIAWYTYLQNTKQLEQKHVVSASLPNGSTNGSGQRSAAKVRQYAIIGSAIGIVLYILFFLMS